ncbi:MAG: phage major capsid protein [Phycisphaeraceae bacterium]|nr:phage major capsid protein [Phycisphaeraceae bacterium]
MPTQTKPPAQTDPQKNEIANRQIEILERHARGEMTTDEQLREARTALVEELRSVRTLLDAQRAQIDQGAADLHMIRDLQAEQQRIADALAQNSLAMLDQRQRGGLNANLRVFDDERSARDFALLALSRCAHGRDQVLSRNETLARQADAINKRDLTGAPGSGDSFVQQVFDTQILGTIFKFTVLQQYVRVLPMPEKKVTMRRRGGRVRGYRVSRGSPITTSDLGDPQTFDLDAGDYGALSIVNNFLLDDNNMLPSIGDMIAEDMADAIAEMWEDEALNGVASGAVSGFPYNPGNYYFTGMLQSNLIAQHTIQSATIAGAQFEDYLAAFAALERIHAPGAKLHVDRSAIFALRGKKDNHGNFVWAPAANGAPGTIMGVEYEWGWRRMPRTSDADQAGKPFGIYGDLRKLYYLGLRKQFTVDESKEFKFDTNETAFRGLARCAMTVGHYPDAAVALRTAAG